MKVERYQPEGLLDTAARMQYAQAVRAGNLLFVSGQAGWDANMGIPADYEEECRAVFENIKAVLAAAGCDFSNVVEAVSLHTPETDIGTFWRVRNEYFNEPWPAWTLIGDIGLALPAMHVEVKVTAAIPG
jgi:enamine deaminase RidA (YjgF/YER057c/UK114 family)